jgi:Ca2+-binding EF-hand superfamily protein
MRSEALDRAKLVFTLFDANGNGHLDPDDFELMARNVNAAATRSEEADRSAMTAAFRQYWVTLAGELDADHDGRITFDEFTSCVLSPERFEETIAEFARSLSTLGDPDGDGRVERPDFMALMTAIGFARPNIDKLFDALGPSAADSIPVHTWFEAIKEYYAPDKGGIAADLLVGDAAV